MVVIESKRDQRFLNLLVQVGHEAVAQASSKLAGVRKAYSSMVAKALSLVLLQALDVAPISDAAGHIQEIARLKVRSCT